MVCHAIVIEGSGDSRKLTCLRRLADLSDSSSGVADVVECFVEVVLDYELPFLVVFLKDACLALDSA